MRVWMVDPKVMCLKHVLGEHVECHMFVGTLNKGIGIEGYLKKRLLEVHNLKTRHDALASELKRRGYKHHSELPSLFQGGDEVLGSVSRSQSVEELRSRCSECRKLITAAERQGLFRDGIDDN